MDPDVTPFIVTRDILYDLSLIKDPKKLKIAAQVSVHHLENICLKEIEQNPNKYTDFEKNFVKEKYNEIRTYL